MPKKPNNKYTKAQWQLLGTRMYKRCLKYELTIKQNCETIFQQSCTIRRLEKNLEDVSKVLGEKLDEFITENEKLAKANIEVTRAYNGLAQMGKFAEEQGIDIKKHSKKLPENNKYDFKQEHTVLESGKVRHKYTLTPKKKPKRKIQEGEMFYGKPYKKEEE